MRPFPWIITFTFAAGLIVGGVFERNLVTPSLMKAATNQIEFLEQSHKSERDFWQSFNDNALRELCPKDLPDLPRLEGHPIMCGQSMAGQDLKIFTCFKKKVCYVTVDNVGVKELP